MTLSASCQRIQALVQASDSTDAGAGSITSPNAAPVFQTVAGAAIVQGIVDLSVAEGSSRVC
jgi:hypothetical protein